MGRFFAGIAEGVVERISQASGQPLHAVQPTGAWRGQRPGARGENDHDDPVRNPFTLAALPAAENR